jgi:hypothetical protein
VKISDRLVDEYSDESEKSWHARTFVGALVLPLDEKVFTLRREK